MNPHYVSYVLYYLRKYGAIPNAEQARAALAYAFDNHLVARDPQGKTVVTWAGIDFITDFEAD